MFVRKATMTINDKREKVAKRRHEHEIFQAKLLRKELLKMSKHDKDWFDEHVIIDFGDFNNKGG